MKKSLYILLISLFLIIPISTKALELEDGTKVDVNNWHLYIEENATRINNFNSSWFPDGFKAVTYNYDDNLIATYIYRDFKMYYRNSTALNSYYEFEYKTNWIQTYYNKTLNCIVQNRDDTECMDMSEKTLYFTLMHGNDLKKLDTLIYSTEDLYYNDTLVFEKNWNSIPKYFEVKFNIPSGALIELKDNSNNIVEPYNKTTYQLKTGLYTYSVSRDLYHTYTGTINVNNEDLEIDVKLDMIMDLTDFNNIFLNYKNYLLDLSSKIFNIERPFFLVVISIVIVFSVIVLIKNILKGRF